ncbi:C-type lectin domain family 11 member A, partial [Elysia marginata]
MTYDKVVFEKARLKCKNSGGILAMPKTKDTNDFLIAEMKKLGHYKPMWIGMHDTVEEGKFVWEDGTDVDDLGNFDWKNGLFGGGEDCIALDPRDGKWYDYVCFQKQWFKVTPNHKLPFICQYPIEKDSGNANQGSHDDPVKGDKTGNGTKRVKDQNSHDTAGSADQSSQDTTTSLHQGGGATAATVGDINKTEESLCDDGYPTLNCSDCYKVEDGCQVCKCAVDEDPTDAPGADDKDVTSDQGGADATDASVKDAGAQAAKDPGSYGGSVKIFPSNGNTTKTIVINGTGVIEQTTPGATKTDAKVK